MSLIQIQTKSNGINFTSTQRLGVAALLAVASTVAIAEDKMNWAGPYAGINTGYTWAHDKDETYLAYKGCKEGCPASAGNHANGSSIGAVLGYNFLLQNNLLLGIETEFKSYNANKESNFFTPSSDLLFEKINSSFEKKFSLLGKIGYLVNDKTLVYVKGGWANAQIKRDYTNDAFPTAVVESHKSWQDGWALGIGSEYNFYQNLTAKLEYRYTDLGSKSIYASNSSSTQTQNTRQNELNVGVAYHF